MRGVKRGVYSEGCKGWRARGVKVKLKGCRSVGGWRIRAKGYGKAVPFSVPLRTR